VKSGVSNHCYVATGFEDSSSSYFPKVNLYFYDVSNLSYKEFGEIVYGAI